MHPPVMKRNSRVCALSLLLVSVLALAVGSDRKRPFRSIKAPAETITNYDVVLPRITYKDNAKPYPESVEVFVSVAAANFTLHLELNRDLFPPNFESISYDENGKEVVKKGHVNCFYHGEVEEYPKWVVAMSLCHGIQGSFGDLADNEVYYHIEPLDPQDKSMDQPHALYLASEYTPQQGTCGSKHDHDDARGLPYLGNLTEASNGRLRRQGGNLFVEWLLVNDFAEYDRFGRNLENTVQRAIEIANLVNMLYRQLPQNVRVVLSQVITWTTGDQISVTPDPQTLLTRFRDDYTPPNPNFDSRMLITGIDLTGNTVGIAFTGTMCGFSAVGVSQDRGSAVDAVGSTAAHEMGHIFDMAHDSSPRGGCNCQDPSGNCIMAAVSGFPSPSQWSQCSINDLNGGLNNRGLGRCLDNEPTMIVGDPVCGNGIREGNEVCDCGSPQECTDPCCNAQTCRLASGAECSAGLCCQSNCQFRPYGTTCRAASGQCDITEYCSGDNFECPADVNLQDGTTCNSNQGYCFDGACPTHEDQCIFHFGSGSGMPVLQCYQTNNVRGDQFGNCGHTSTQFLTCAAADVLCGQLQCLPGVYQRTADVSVTIGTASVFDPSTRNVEPCQSFTTQPGADTMSPGLVRDGTRCGDGRLCFEQDCISLSQLGVQSCGTGSNGQTCSGNGQCNNLGQCSCNVGSTGTVCQTPTSGPGSGPVNECLTNNGGCAQICVDTVNSFTCSCNSGFTLASNGLGCNNINECNSNNGGCSQTCTDLVGSFRCSCRTGFRLAGNGRGCDDINECNTNNGGCSQTCTNLVGSFRCSCGTGFRLAGDQRTCSDINECSEGTSGCSQTCTNLQGTFRCGCNTGFRLNSNDRTCSDINECSEGTAGCEEFCANTAGSFQCSCRNGFGLASDGRSCTNINECSTNNGGCQQTCSDSQGSFSCSCRSGFSLDSNGRTCSDNNECGSNNGGCSQTCINEAGGFRCSCLGGFQLGNDGRSCSDINECSTSNGGCEHSCSNSQGSFSCSCRSGFSLDNNGRTCSDNNECSSNNGGCSQTCINEDGGFRCSCLGGFQLGNDGRSCSDINECSDRDGGCEHFCSNTQGSFSCSCQSGFTLDSDGKNCNDNNECNSNNGGCNQVCTNTAGSFRCSCNNGFQLGSDRLTCSAINQCVEGTHDCEQLCTNNAGTFTCSCQNGFRLDSDQKGCTDINECAENIDGCAGQCENSESSFTCSCSSGFRVAADGRSCADVNECVEGTSDCTQSCINRDGSYDCACFDGFRIAADSITCVSVSTGDTPPGGGTNTNNTVVPGGDGNTNTQGSDSSSNLAPIIGGVVAGVLVLGVLVVVVVVTVILMKRKKRKSDGHIYKPPSNQPPRGPLHKPQPYLSSYPSSFDTNSQSNLLEALEPSEQVGAHQLHAFSPVSPPVRRPPYQPPAYIPPVPASANKTGGGSRPATGQARRAPPAPPTQQTHAPARRQAPASPRYEAPPKPTKPDPPAKSIPPAKPSKPVAPLKPSIAPPVKPPTAAYKPPVQSSKPLVASAKPPVASSKPPVASAKPPVASAKPPVASAKPPVVSAKPAPTVPSNKPKPSSQAPLKPAPAPKPVPAGSKLPVQWPPPPSQQDGTSPASSSSSTSAKKPLAPPRKPLLPPRK